MYARSEVGEVLRTFDNEQFVRVASSIAPLLAIGEDAMSDVFALWCGWLLLISARYKCSAFGAGVLSMSAIGFCALGGMLAVAAGNPEEAKVHYLDFSAFIGFV